MSEIVKSEYNALGEDNNYKTHFFKTSADQVVGLGRMKNTEYQVGDVVYSDTNNKVALKCTTVGTTSNTELDISGNNIGDTVTDGSVVWEVVKRSNVLDVEDVLPIANGGTGGNTFVKSASISGKDITLNMSDGTNKTLTTQDTVNDGTVTVKLAYQEFTTPSNGKVFTISGLTPYKPVIIAVKRISRGSAAYTIVHVNSGTAVNATASEYTMLGSDDSVAWRTVIPTGTTLTVTVMGNGNKNAIVAYQ
jgi:hypothetical protein